MRPAFLVLLVAGTAALTACRDSTAPAPATPATAAGTYVLRTVSGHALPVATFVTHAAWDVVADTLTLHADGTCEDRTQIDYEDGLGYYVEHYAVGGACTWAVDASGVTFPSPPAPTRSSIGPWYGFAPTGAGRLDGRTLTLTTAGGRPEDAPLVWVFERR